MSEQRTTNPTLPVVWFEVMGTDTSHLQSFYASAFGWEFVPMGPDGYGMVNASEGGIPGGVGAAPPSSPDGGWVTFYVGSADIHADVARAEEAGATVLMPPTEMPEIWLAMVADPEGHRIGLVHTKAQPAS